MERNIKSIKKALARKKKQLAMLYLEKLFNPDHNECFEYEKEISALEIELMNRKNRR